MNEVDPREKLTDEDELLWRQVHPSFMRDGRPSGQAFAPTKKDEGQLSVARSSLTTAGEAFELHTVQRGLASAGTWAVTVGECSEQVLQVLSDPIVGSEVVPADPAHAVVDFRAHSRNQQEARGSRLARKASDRRRVQPPADE